MTKINLFQRDIVRLKFVIYPLFQNEERNNLLYLDRADQAELEDPMKEVDDWEIDIEKYEHLDIKNGVVFIRKTSDNKVPELFPHFNELVEDEKLEIKKKLDDNAKVSCSNDFLVFEEEGKSTEYRLVARGCTFKNNSYDETFEHLWKEHFMIFVEEQHLDDEDYTNALKILDNDQSDNILRSDVLSEDMAFAKEIFKKYNSRNLRYFRQIMGTIR